MRARKNPPGATCDRRAQGRSSRGTAVSEGPAQPRSRCEITPNCSARSASLARFWFCGSSPSSNLPNSARRCILTASTLRKTSSAICWLVAGSREAAVAIGPAEGDQNPALGVGQLDGGQVAGRDRLLHERRLRGVVGEHRAPDANAVPVAQALAAADALAVDVGPVRREPVVDDRPFSAEVVQLGVQAGDLAVPRDRQIHLGAATHGAGRVPRLLALAAKKRSSPCSSRKARNASPARSAASSSLSSAPSSEWRASGSSLRIAVRLRAPLGAASSAAAIGHRRDR